MLISDVLKIIIYYCGDEISLRLVSKFFRDTFDSLEHKPIRVELSPILHFAEFKKILKTCRRLNRCVSISGIFDRKRGIQRDLILKYRDVIGNFFVKDQGFTYDIGNMKFRGFKNLKSIVHNDCSYRDIDVKNCKKLEILDLAGCDILSVELVKVFNLKKLALNNSHMRHLSGIEKIISLTYLDLSGTFLADISFLKDLLNLKTLHIGYTKVKNINVLSNLKNLKTLDISYTSVIDISPLQNLQLLRIYISGNKIDDYSVLDDIGVVGCMFSILDKDNYLLPKLENYKIVESSLPSYNFLYKKFK